MSDKNMDDLLAQIKSEFEPELKANSNSNPNKSPARKSSPPQPAPSQASMEQMLAELRADLESGRGRPDNDNTAEQSTTPKKPNKASVVNSAKDRDRLNALIDTDYRRQAHKREQKLAEIKRQEEAELAEIKRQEAARIAEEKRHQQELIEIQKREELKERRRKEALREAAKEWLVKLNPRSEEGKWFEEFSDAYEDKLKAAIDYLEAMRETGL